MQVKLEEFFVDKQTQYGTIKRSTKQDKVFLFVEEVNNWRLCGYVSHAARVFTGLVNFPQELGEPVAAECSKIKGFPVRWAGAPEDVSLLPKEEEYELIGEAEEQDTED